MVDNPLSDMFILRAFYCGVFTDRFNYGACAAIDFSNHMHPVLATFVYGFIPSGLRSAFGIAAAPGGNGRPVVTTAFFLKLDGYGSFLIRMGNNLACRLCLPIFDAQRYYTI